MKKVFVVCAAVGIAMAAGVGCVAGNAPQAPAPCEAYQYTDPARPLIVSPGAKFAIVIASNRTTGFSWQFAQPINEKVVKLVGTEYVPSKSDLDGAGGKEVWTFTAVAAGQATVYLKYVRPWEKDKTPEQEAAYTVVVR
ncbi:protease inhibitor I42 family protein [Syntrophorhabdus aromaticivorans]|jgi:predicted secreted protein|uniref:Protease inhibitor I42 family protein n=1 Tax=Syntrophorhabdus aromaticivorans TaxID=328301 RepID=A0A971M611_9BACT|nr:protease inhibitor I42 family protein [Syntrophorhabdus aromaticivorans]NLW36567.1 protease inhibitor I42 family protein [Syntrophorhabdus aromaticivorans]